MVRSAVQVTRVVSGDDESFVELWRQSKLADGYSAEYIDRALRDGRLTRACAREDVRMYAATVDSEQVGYVIVMSGPVSALQDNLAVWVDVLWVRPGRRQRGVAGALLKAIALYAEHIGAPEIVSCVPSTSKDANRFFARLGFAAVVTERATTPAALQRRLAGPGLSAVSDAVRRRRTLRAARTRVRQSALVD